jgi:hypothetical protein
MHLPLQMVNTIVSSSTYEFNEFKTYLSFAFHTSGNCKLNNTIKNDISNHLGISQRTLNKHIQSLIDKNYFGYNIKTNTLFINGLKKIKRLVYINNDYNDDILTKTSFVLNVSDFKNLKFLTFSATESLILKYQSKYKDRLIFEKYLVSNNLLKRYNNGSENTKTYLKKIYNSEKKTKGDSIKKENPNHLSSNLYMDDKEYLGVSNSFISNKFNRSKSWGSKMKKKSSLLCLLEYKKKFKLIDSFPITFNVRKYLLINCPEKYSRFITKRQNDMIVVYETGYDEIKSNVKLTTRRVK